MDAVTRLRKGELRFRKGQNANVHRLHVAGGGPFCTARCRDRSTHSVLQESSAGRNLITVFKPVNNPAEKIFRRTRPSSGHARTKRQAWRAAHLRATHRPRSARACRAHKKSPFSNTPWLQHRLRLSKRCATDTRRSPVGAGSDRRHAPTTGMADRASHKSICAKTARTFFGRRMRRCRAARRRRGVIAGATGNAHATGAPACRARSAVPTPPREAAVARRTPQTTMPARMARPASLVRGTAAGRGAHVKDQWSSSSSSSA